MRIFLLAGASLLALSASVDSAAAAPVTFAYTGGFQTFTAATTGTYDILAFGAQGGTSLLAIENGNLVGAMGYLGAEIGGDFVLTAGETLQIAVGGMGGNGGGGAGGGGGGSFVVVGSGNTPSPLVIVGGGGGGGGGGSGGGSGGQAGTAGGTSGGIGGTDGSGGYASPSKFDGEGGSGFISGGYYFNGPSHGNGYPSLAVGSGNFGGGPGGFGGGGGAGFGAGGGGCYSGGGAGGGGSFLATDVLANSDLVQIASVNSGDGSVVITLIPEPASFAMLGTGLAGLLTLRRRRWRASRADRRMKRTLTT